MIKARLDFGAESFGLRLSGHAGFAPEGEDIVCAAVSTLVFALLRYLERGEGTGMLKAKSIRGPRKGFARLSASPEEGQRERLLGAFELAECFLELLAENYPGNISSASFYEAEKENKNDLQA